MSRRWIGLVLGFSMLSSGCITVTLPGLGGGPFQETVVDGEDGPKILMLDLSGPLSELLA